MSVDKKIPLGTPFTIQVGVMNVSTNEIVIVKPYARHYDTLGSRIILARDGKTYRQGFTRHSKSLVISLPKEQSVRLAPQETHRFQCRTVVIKSQTSRGPDGCVVVPSEGAYQMTVQYEPGPFFSRTPFWRGVAPSASVKVHVVVPSSERKKGT